VPADERAAAHISSPEWQSFETRMRARRAERCFQRAATAIESSSATEAREALDEARILSPADPRVGELESRLVTLHQRVGDAAVDPATADHIELNALAAASLVRPPLATTRTIEPAPTALERVEPIAPEIGPREASTAMDAESVAAGAFEPMVDLDRMRRPTLEGWSGFALAPPSREWNRTTAVLACGLLVSALVGWQAWAHKDLIPTLPNAYPDIDASTGLAASPSHSAAAAPSTAPGAAPAAETASTQPDPKVVEEPVATAPRSDAEVTFASDPKPVGSAGDDRPSAANAAPADTPSQPAAASANRETVVPSTTSTFTSARKPESTAIPPVADSRPPAASTPAVPEPSSTPVPAPSPAPVVGPPTVAPDLPSVALPGNSGSSRMEPAPSLPSSPPSTPPPSASLTYAARDQSSAVRTTLNRYEAAFTRLDVAAVHSVWPSLDERALTRAFDGLASQRVSLGSCSVNVNGTAARADCSGTAAWTPKVGGGEHMTSRKWTFDLTESDGAWRIVRVQAR
jgi:hypothetical protein